MPETITLVGTGGIIEGNLGTSNVNVNLDRSLMFDGTNDFIDCGTDTDHDFTDHFTLACWAKNDNATTTGGDREHLIAKYEGSNGKRLFRLYLHGSTLRFGVGYNSGNSSVEITHSMTGLAEHWNHYAATFDGGVMKLYVNGVLVTNTDNSGTLTAIHANNAIELEIGAYQSGSHTWTGQIADVRIYNAVLTDANIQLLASKINTDSSLGAGTTNLKGYWKLNNETASGGGSGTGFIVDESGTVNQGTLTNFSGTYWDYDAYSVDVYDNSTTTDGTFTVTQGKVEGLALSSVELNGSDDFININNPLESWTESAQKTFALWVYNDGNASETRIFNTGFEDSGSKTAFALGMSFGTANRPFYFIRNTSASALKAQFGEVHPTSTWMHYVIVQDGANDKAYLYQNGVLQETVSSVGEINATTSTSAKLGRHWDSSGNFFDGKLRDLRLYDYDFSDEQVASLYSATYPQTPLHHWKLDEGYTSGTTANTAGAFEDSGTGTDYDAQGSGLVNASCVNGTLDLDGQLVVAANGTLSMPRGDLQMSIISSGLTSFEINCTDVTTQFIHNNGQFVCDASNAFEIDANGAAFYKVKANTSGGNLRLIDNTIIEKELVSGTGASVLIGGDKTYTFGTATESADINHVLRASLSGGVPTVTGASTLYPVNINVYDDMARDYDLKLANVNVTTALVHNRDKTITLTGDCEFDAVTVSSGDTLDLNGQRAEFSGVLQNSGAIKSTGGGLIIADDNIKHSGSMEGMHDGDVNVIVNGGTAHDWRLGAADGAAPWCRHLLTNGTVQVTDDIGRTDGTQYYNPESIIVGSGTLTNTTTVHYVKDMTIATGATFTPSHGSVTCGISGDFTTSGGLLGASCLSLDRDNTEYAQIPYHADLLFPFNRNAITAEMWFKTGYTGNNHQHLFNLKDVDGNPQVFQAYIEWSTNKINARVFTSGTTNTLVSTSTVRDGKWHHLALVYDGGTGEHSLYVDGKLEASETGTGGIYAATDAEFNIGTRWTLDQGYVEGEIDEVRLFAAAKTAAQIRADMFKDVGTSLTHFNSAADASTDGLVGRWGCNEGTGSALSCSNSNLNGVIYDYNGGSPAAYTDAWAGAGTFTYGTSTLKMTGTSKKLTWTGNENVGNLQISGTTTLEEINGNDGYLQFNGTFTVDASKTLASTSAERLIFNSSSDSIVINNAATGISGLYSLEPFHTSGNVNIPACTTARILCWGSGGTTTATGDLTLTTELEVNSGTTFNANGNTIGYKALDINGTLDLRNSTAQSIDANSDYIDFTGGTLLSGNSTLQGYATGGNRTEFKAPASQNLELVGTAKWLDVFADSDLTVIGAVIDCDASASGANIRQWHHTLDTQQLLDADSDGDDDLRLTKPALDNALELMTK